MTNRYTRGTAHAVVRNGAVVLLPGEVSPETVEALWTALDGQPGVLALLEALTGTSRAGLRELPPFAMVVRSGNGVQVAVRGAAAVQVGSHASTTVVDGQGVSTWVERGFDDVGWFAVLADAAHSPNGSTLVIESGVVLAASVAGGAPREDTEPGVRVEEGRAAPSVGEAVPVARPARDRVVEVMTTEPEPAELVVASPSTGDVPVEETGFDHLWGRTIHRGVEAAAVRQADEVEPAAPQGTPGDGIEESTVLSSAIADLKAAAPRTDTLTTSTPEPAGVVDGAPRPGPSAGGGAEVLARSCVAGHLNPPQRTDCATCHAELVGDARTVARPPLGSVTVSDGRRFTLDRPAVVGRSPRSQRAPGDDLPRLVTVPSPEGDISRSHVEVRLEGWHVLVTDLATTNGTTLLRGGQPPMRLHPRDPAMVCDGDVVDLGDGVTLAFDGIS
ncbi:FHA domain-containing protein [Isoptericola croceus]|uniref:FHA domain-containing protein n=1 Tax=Isoptericola croceus TaxID=3031406 RepID=UPI0023F6ED55|nr:FHA domain-containing protein [Isoptericola croceus]